MRLNCSQCKLEFDLPGDDWKDSVTCPRCKADVLPQKAATVLYAPTNVVELSPPGGELRPDTLRDDEILPPDSLLGQYRIGGFIGRGGMGAVYKAMHILLQRTVALKVLPAKLAKDSEFVNRFKREALALANLSHPNIVAIHDMGQQGEIYYFVMEYVDGVNMRDVLAHKKLSPENALKIVPQLCEALEYAHSKGIIHRDIKPENILIDRNGQAKIADFGLAKIIKGDSTIVPLTQTNVVMGTVEYMAPEQRDNLKLVDHRADIYSLGVILYEMLTGELPIGKFEMPSQKVKIDVRVDEVVLKALERDPDRRYQRAGLMGTAVSQVATIVPGSTPPGPARIVDLRTQKAVGTCAGQALAIRTADADLEAIGWEKAEIGVEPQGEVLAQGDEQRPILQATAATGRLRVFVPRGIELDVVAASADVTLRQLQGKAALKLASGDLHVELHDGPLGVALQSGDVRLRKVRSEECDVRVGSGDVHVEEMELSRGRASLETQHGDIHIGLAASSSVRYTLQTVSGEIACPMSPRSGGTVSGVLGSGTASLYARTNSGDLTLKHGDGAEVNLQSLKGLWGRATQKQKERIGVFVIVNAAFFLFFLFVAGTVIPAVCIATFWGMGLAIDLWKNYIRGTPGAPSAPAVREWSPRPAMPLIVDPMPPSKSWSFFAILAFLTAGATLVMAIVAGSFYIGERSGATLSMSAYDLHDMRVANLVIVFVTLGMAVISLFMCVAAGSHVQESREMLKGRFLARGGGFISLAALLLVVAVLLPYFSRLESETEEAQKAVDQFVSAINDGRYEQAREWVSGDSGDLQQQARELKNAVTAKMQWKDAGRTILKPMYVSVVPEEDRGLFRYRAISPEHSEASSYSDISLVKEGGRWKIHDPFGPALEEIKAEENKKKEQPRPTENRRRK